MAITQSLTTGAQNKQQSIINGRDQHSIELANRMRGGLGNLRQGESVLVIFPRDAFSPKSSASSRKHGDIAIVRRNPKTNKLERCSGYTSKTYGNWGPVSKRMESKATVYVFNNSFRAQSAKTQLENYGGKVGYCYRNTKDCLGIRKYIPSHLQASAYMFDQVSENRINAMGLTRVSKTGTISDFTAGASQDIYSKPGNNVIQASNRFAGYCPGGHTVKLKSGGTLYKLAKENCGNAKLWPLLAAANNIAFDRESCNAGQKHTRNLPIGHPIHIPNITNKSNPLADPTVLQLLTKVAKTNPKLALTAIAKLANPSKQFSPSTSGKQFANSSDINMLRGLVLGLLIARASQGQGNNFASNSSLTNNNYSPVQTQMDKLLGKNKNVNYSPVQTQNKQKFLAKLLKDIPRSRHKFASFAYDESKKAGLDPEAYCRQLKQESNFNPNARSYVGAEGVCQFMPATGKKYGLYSQADRKNPYKAIPASVRMMARLKRKYGDQTLATAAYNGGGGAIDFVKSRLGKSKITGNEWLNYMQARQNKLGTAKKSAWHVETLNYAKKIMKPTQLAA